LSQKGLTTPAPGSYVHKEGLGKEGPKFSMSIKPNASRPTHLDAPGPGAYGSTLYHLRS
jgi:hypothetical protein